MNARTLALLSVLAGCGGSSSSSPPASDAAADAFDTSDAGWVLDTGPDLSTACPGFLPGDGQPCTAIGPCEFKDDHCGGTIKASCTAGHWALEPKLDCGPYCPPLTPTDGSSCSTYPAGRVCASWPGAGDVCTSCACTDGKWVCTSPATCPYGRLDCRPGTACTANTGCGAGKCNNYCVCGNDAALHCISNPC